MPNALRFALEFLTIWSFFAVMMIWYVVLA